VHGGTSCSKCAKVYWGDGLNQFRLIVHDGGAIFAAALTAKMKNRIKGMAIMGLPASHELLEEVMWSPGQAAVSKYWYKTLLEGGGAPSGEAEQF